MCEFSHKDPLRRSRPFPVTTVMGNHFGISALQFGELRSPPITNRSQSALRRHSRRIDRRILVDERERRIRLGIPDVSSQVDPRELAPKIVQRQSVTHQIGAKRLLEPVAPQVSEEAPDSPSDIPSPD